MKHTFLKMKPTIKLALCAGVLALQAMPGAWAQPDPNDAPKGENPPERDRGNRPRRGDNAEQMRQRLRQMLTQVGVAEATTQDTILEYIRTDMEARRPLFNQSRNLYQALRGGVTDEQMLALVTDYRAAQEAEKARREQAQAALDEKVGYTKNARLEAVLLLVGVIGDGQGGMGMMFMGGGNGREGRNGQGQGGQGQGQPGQLFGGGGNNQNLTPDQRAAQREERRKQMLDRFDANKDGKLDEAEEDTLRKWREERRGNRNNNRNNNNQLPAPPADAPAPAVAPPAAEAMEG